MTRGSTPATAPATMRTRGLTEYFSPIAALPTISAAAPSLIPLALPAVTTPSAESERSPPRTSRVEVGRGCSSASTVKSGFFRP